MTPITFADLDSAMLSLGFLVKSLPDGHTSYVHSSADITVFMPPHQGTDVVPADRLATARRMTVERGLVAMDGWNRLFPSRFRQDNGVPAEVK